MTAQRSEQPEPLTDAQRAVVDRARQTPYTVSRTYRRTEPGTAWTHKPFVTLKDDVDALDLLHRERLHMIPDWLAEPEEESS